MNTRTAAEQGLRSLFHYQPFNVDRLKPIFTENVIYCSDPAQFNDPWDCRPCFSTAMLDSPEGYERVLQWFVRVGHKQQPISDEERQRRVEILRNDRAMLEGFIEQLTQQMYEAVRAQYRVYCLLPQADAPLMWAHYAASHTGVCLEFTVQNSLFCGALPVSYCDLYPEFDVSDNTEDRALDTLLSKSDVWEYEREFRLIAATSDYAFPGLPRCRKDNFIPMPTGALKSVTMGCCVRRPMTDAIPE